MTTTGHAEVSAGQRLRDMRESAGMTRADLAAAASVAGRTIDYVENGRHSPVPRVKSAIAAALGAAIETIWPVHDTVPVVVAERERRGLSLRQAAAEMRIAPATLLRVEHGEPVRPGTLDRVAAFYGLDRSDLEPRR